MRTPDEQYITSCGKLFNKYNNEWKEAKYYKGTCGYYEVTFNKKKMLLHRLVAEKYINNNNNLPEVNHINGNRYDNRLNNLEWISHKDNTIHAHKNNLVGNHTPCISPEGVYYNSTYDAAKAEGITGQAIRHRLKKGLYGWRYA